MGKPDAKTPIENGDLEALRRSVEDADRAMDAGEFIRHEDIRRWLLSWGTENELPPPSGWK